MKTTKILSLIVLAAVVLAVLCGCSSPVDMTETEVIVKAEGKLTEGCETLEDYMAALQEAGKLSYVASDGMVTEINGKKADYAADKTNWMLYTDDEENSNSAWGTYEHDGKTLASASLGMGDLPLKEGAVYVWVIVKF